MLPPSMLTVRRDRGDRAGPWRTEPSVMENRLPWQPHTMSPSWTPATMHPLCVHVALNASNWPDAGWVTTTASLVRTVPPPTGTSPTFATSWPAGGVGGGGLGGSVCRAGGGFGGGGGGAADVGGGAFDVAAGVGEARRDGGTVRPPVLGTGAERVPASSRVALSTPLKPVRTATRPAEAPAAAPISNRRVRDGGAGSGSDGYRGMRSSWREEAVPDT